MEALLEKELQELGFVELNDSEIVEIQGGEPVTLITIAVLAGVGLGAVVVGAVVGYGIYSLVRWATE